MRTALSRKREVIDMNSKDKEMLEVYRNASGFTIQALEESIVGLRKGISDGNYNSKTIELLKDRLENLGEWLVKIEIDF